MSFYSLLLLHALCLEVLNVFFGRSVFSHVYSIPHDTDVKERRESLRLMCEIFFTLVPRPVGLFCLEDGEISKRFV